MRRTERLFAILQLLRARRGAVTAGAIARELEVSVRTIYRDVAELVAQRVPVRGDAGVGYRLEPGYELPPLMLTPDELEAAMLGAAWVAQRGDPGLARGARSLVEKLGQVVPKALRPLVLEAGVRPAPHVVGNAPDALDLAPIRRAIRERRKLELRYVDAGRNATTRVVWPILLAYLDAARLVVAHCERRDDLRHFRTDRIQEARVLDERIPVPRADLVRRWEATLGPRSNSRPEPRANRGGRPAPGPPGSR